MHWLSSLEAWNKQWKIHNVLTVMPCNHTTAISEGLVPLDITDHHGTLLE